MPNKNQFPKAQSKKLKQAWLILSNNPQELKDKFFLQDFLFEAKGEKLEKVQARKLWLVLSQNGIYLHPQLQKQYMLQRTCFFDGGEIVTRTADDTNYEEICGECGYLYDEK